MPALSAGGGGARNGGSTTARPGGDGFRGQVIVSYYTCSFSTTTTPVITSPICNGATTVKAAQVLKMTVP